MIFMVLSTSLGKIAEVREMYITQHLLKWRLERKLGTNVTKFILKCIFTFHLQRLYSTVALKGRDVNIYYLAIAT